MPALSRTRKFIEDRLSPEGELGLHLTAGVLLLALAAWAFGHVVDQVFREQDWLQLDRQVWAYVQTWAQARLTPWVLLLTHMHSLAGMVVLASMLGWYFHRRQASYWLLALAVAVPGGMLLNVLLKYIFTRARPEFGTPILTLSTYSFPSGHTAAATLFYGFLAAYLVCQTRRWGMRALVVAAAVLMVVLVGASRIYLGVHFFSDVLAAVFESCAWLAVCITAGSTLRRRRAGAAQRQTLN